LLAAIPTAHAAPVPVGDSDAFKPTIVWRVKPLNDLLDDARYVTNLIARLAPSDPVAKEIIGAADRGLDSALGADWRKAVDTAKPILGYLTLDATLPNSTGVLLVPVRDEKQFLTSLERLVGKVESGANGAHRFDRPGQAGNGYVRFLQGYAYLAMHDPALLAPNRIPAPAQVYPGAGTAVASARLFLERLPQPLKDAALTGIRQFKTALRGEAPPVGVFGIGMAELMIVSPLIPLEPFLEPAIREGQDLTLDFRFDRPRLDFSYDLTLTPKPGSDLARTVAAVVPAKSQFGPLLGADPAARWQVRLTLPEDLRKVVVTKLEALFQNVPDNAPTWAALALSALKKGLPTIRDGEIDIALGLRGPHKAECYVAVAGLRIKDATGVERAVRDAVKEMPKEAQGMIKLDAATIGNLKVHQIQPPPLPEPAKSIFGDGPLHFAFSQDALLVAFGPDALSALKDGMAAKPQPTPGLVMEASAKRLLPLVTKANAEAGKMLSTFIGNEIDVLRLVSLEVEGGPALKVRYGNGIVPLVAGFGFFRTVAVPAQPPPPVARPLPQRPPR
jgi:hypothetical protein